MNAFLILFYKDKYSFALQNDEYLSALLDFDNIYNKTTCVWLWVKKALSMCMAYILWTQCSCGLHSHKSFLSSKSIYLIFGFLHRHLNFNVCKPSPSPPQKNKTTATKNLKNKLPHLLECLFWVTALCNRHYVITQSIKLREILDVPSGQLRLRTHRLITHLLSISFLHPSLDACSLASLTPTAQESTHQTPCPSVWGFSSTAPRPGTTWGLGNCFVSPPGVCDGRIDNLSTLCPRGLHF